MKHTQSQWLATALAFVCAAFLATINGAALSAASTQSDLSGLASVSGSVTSSEPFQAARVYLRNTEKRIQYMVYTAGGKYTAMHLFPGAYEMRVEGRGLESAVKKV